MTESAASTRPQTGLRSSHHDPGNGAAPDAVQVRQFILKVHSRCDLRCDYCYVYTMADQSWRHRPRLMPGPVVEAAARKIGDHARAHHLASVDVILHGGEPLLAGPEHIAATVRSLRRRADPDVEVRVAVQTNGVRLDDDYLRLFDELGVRVAVSLDGTATMHDRHRRRPDGRGSHEAVAKALGRLGSPRYRHLFSGLLCTIDLENDPIATYEAMLDFSPPVVDFLLPHGTWSSPPPRGPAPGGGPGAYGAWLSAVFDRWYSATSAETEVRLLAEIVNLLLGGRSAIEDVGSFPAAAVVVETDGAVELSDMFKAVGMGAGATGQNVTARGFSFDRLPVPPSAAGFSIGGVPLSSQCQSCSVVGVCGGGLFAHRYNEDNGYDNPSVYCDDLFALITHIRSRLTAALAGLTQGAR